MSQDRIEINGAPASAADLAFLAQVNYGHFTTFQVRERSAHGFALHLARLEHATRSLFGSALDIAHTRGWIRRVLDERPASLRVTVFSRALDRAHLEKPVVPDVLVACSAAREAPHGPLRVRSIVHERVLPGIKHVGTFGLFHHWRQARLDGFDDVLFTTPAGEISEGSIWNIGFWDGERVMWPSAPALDGITRQLLDAGLRARGIETITRRILVDELDGYRTAFTMNSGSVGRAITQIDDQHFAMDPDFQRLLIESYESMPREKI